MIINKRAKTLSLRLSLSASLSVCLWGAGLVTMATTSNGEANKGSVSLSLSVCLSLARSQPRLLLCSFHSEPAALKDFGMRVVFNHETREFWDLRGNLVVTDGWFAAVLWIWARCESSVLVCVCVCEWWHTSQTRRHASVHHVLVVLTFLSFCPALTLSAAAVWPEGRGLIAEGAGSGVEPPPLIQSFSVRTVVMALSCPALTGHLLWPVCPLTPQWPLTLQREGSVRNRDGRRVSAEILHTIS